MHERARSVTRAAAACIVAVGVLGVTAAWALQRDAAGEPTAASAPSPAGAPPGGVAQGAVETVTTGGGATPTTVPVATSTAPVTVEPTTTTAPPTTAPPPPPPDPCAAMLAAVPLGPPPGWVVRCEGARSGLQAEANPTRRDIRIYLRPSWSTAEAARIYAHELGHAYDWALLTDADRLLWSTVRDITSLWEGDCPLGLVCGDTDRPAGDWAEAVGELLVPGTGLWDSALGGAPSAGQLDVVREILRTHGLAA